MANATKQEVLTAQQFRSNCKANYEAVFATMYHNCVKIENLPSDLPKRYLLKTLYEFGGIAYDPYTQLYLRYTPMQIDVYGLPLRYQLYGYNGTTFTREAKDVIILRANDIQYGVKQFIDLQIDKLVELDSSIRQNLIATRYSKVLELDNQDELLSVTNTEHARMVGAAVVYVHKGAPLGGHSVANDISAEYLVDKLERERDTVYNETIRIMGYVSGGVNKRERVQSEELNQVAWLSSDFLSILVDTFNHDAEVGGLPIRLKNNTFSSEDVLLNIEGKKPEQTAEDSDNTNNEVKA